MTTPWNSSAASSGSAAVAGLPVVAETPVGGFPLVNGFPTILSWTAPNDGKLHMVMIFAEQNVTVAETGGQVVGTVTTPSGNVDVKGMFPAAQGVGIYTPLAAFFPQMRMVQAGSIVQISQNSALTAGAATVWAAIVGQ